MFFLSQGSFSETVYKAISDYERMEEVLSKYQDDYGLGLGDYGLYSLSLKLDTINEKWLLRGKTKNSAYAVKFCVMRNH